MNCGLPSFGDGSAVPMAEALARTLDYMERQGSRSQRGSFVSCGYPNLDAATVGLPCGALTLISGAAKAGKTALALAIARHLAATGNGEVLYVSGAAEVEGLTLRLLSHEAHISIRDLRRGRLQESSWSDLGAAVKLLSDLPLTFLEHRSSRMDNMCWIAACVERQTGLGSVFVDPLSSVRGWSADPFEQRSVLVALRHLAAQFGVAIVLCHSDSNEAVRSEQQLELELAIHHEEDPGVAGTEGSALWIEVRRPRHQRQSVLMGWDDQYVRISQPILGTSRADADSDSLKHSEP